MKDDDCRDPACSCHAQVDGQDALIPDPRTTTEPPF